MKKQPKNCHNLAKQLSLFILTLAGSLAFTLNALPQDVNSVPWDSIVANLKMIESADIDDSLRSGAVKDLFTTHLVDSVRYQHFYDSLMAANPDQQKSFMDRVKAILTQLGAQSPPSPRPPDRNIVTPEKEKSPPKPSG